MQDLRKGDGEFLLLSVFGCNIGLQCEDTVAHSLLYAAYGQLVTTSATPTPLDISYILGLDKTGTGFYVARAGQGKLWARNIAEFLFLFEKDLTVELQHRRPDLFFIHAAAVECDGKAAVIAAPSGTGKSTTTWGLLHDGFRYLSDELAPVDLESGRVYPYPHALCLKSEPPPPYTLPSETLRTTETLHIPVKFLPAEAVMKPTPLAAIFFLSRVGRDNRCHLRDISIGETAARLVANALNPLSHPGNGLDAAIHIAQQARSYELHVTELTDVSSVVRNALK